MSLPLSLALHCIRHDTGAALALAAIIIGACLI